MSEDMSKNLTELERSRFATIWAYLVDNGKTNSSTAAQLLGVEQITTRRLLNKAVKLGLFTSDGKTSDKVYKMAVPISPSHP
jgi:DeoR/GlpR family transcriptional regulator of sugar metabolism